MEKGRQRASFALVAAFALSAALSPSASATTSSAGPTAGTAASQQCHVVRVSKRVRRWAWVPKKRRVHGHRVVVRRHGRIVYIRARVWRRRTLKRVVCTTVPAFTLPPSSLAPPAPGAPRAAAPAQGAPAATPPALQPPLSVLPPQIFGQPRQGQTVTHVDGTWLYEPVSERDQWLKCDTSGATCQAIAGATGETYVPVAGDVGHTLKLEEITSNAAGTSMPAVSAPTEVVSAPAQPPANVSLPAISGTAQEGQTLSAGPGSWTEAPTGYSYAWKRCGALGRSCKAVEGATA